jgi:hypothetical protein
MVVRVNGPLTVTIEEILNYKCQEGWAYRIYLGPSPAEIKERCRSG